MGIILIRSFVTSWPSFTQGGEPNAIAETDNVMNAEIVADEKYKKNVIWFDVYDGVTKKYSKWEVYNWKITYGGKYCVLGVCKAVWAQYYFAMKCESGVWKTW